ncbi:BREX-1 system phosphatase PglZ type B [Aromatoleum evansii]|uniref:BREX-1 system phosphatase PglZ type B n=1 Tax=Aromatoleum evansii TaxID=59406 RepID=A0ABZ1AGF5_AROEV|nr:BREX-1 system phosphatase PglZ type B [Aromatoleum evansii]
MNLLEAVVQALRETGKVNKAIQSQPEAILWTDAERQWGAVVQALGASGRSILTLGDYKPDTLQGPAIWLKCALAGNFEEVSFEGVPVVYMPGVSRADLRAIEACPRHLQPLAELQYRGVFWTQVNAKDWTINAFLTSKKGGLGLDVAQDQATQQALLRAMLSGELLEKPISELQGRHIDATWLDGLLAPNPTRDILMWMNDPQRTTAGWQSGRWEVFASRCRNDYGFDPVKDGELVAAEKLAGRKGSWTAVWELYKDAYASFPAIADLLSKVPYQTGDLFADVSAYPKANDEGEAELRYQLNGLASMTAADARLAIQEAERRHGERRNWLWAKMERAPLAQALRHLAFVAKQTPSTALGSTPEAQADWYRTQGWQVDAEAMQALAQIHTKADQDAVSAALRAVYVPWLEVLSVSFQKAVAANGGLNPAGAPNASDVAGTCVVFIDGLRYDVAKALEERLSSTGQVVLGAGWTALPSVTASGKAWVSPVAPLIVGKPDDADFEPNVASTMKPLNTHNFRKLLADAGYDPLTGNETGDPTGRAWVECGDLDHFGHEHGLRLPRDIDNQLAQVVERVQELVDAGWRRFRIVTDHGWLLVPGGMPKVELAKSQAETRWGRCAVLRESATATPLTFGWDWCPQVQIGFAPGIASFVAGAEYAHGGLSLQECLVPELLLEVSSGAPTVSVSITKVAWRGLRCNVEVSPAMPGLRADLRTKVAAADSSLVAAVKDIVDGKVSLAVPDEECEGAAAVLVVLDDQGKLLAKMNTTVGE